MTKLTPEQYQRKQDRAMLRRAKRRREADGEALDLDTGERYHVEVEDGDSTRDKQLSIEVMPEHLKTLRVPNPVDVEDRALKRRQRYAPMIRRMEIAAYAMAAGASTKLAARKAGVSPRQIRKYQSQADFRDRVIELHETLALRVRGKVISEVNRRTSPEMIKKMELLDLLRVGDRFGLGRGTAGNVVVNDNREIHNYEATFNALFHGTENSQQLSDAEEEGADFPEFEPTSLALSGGDSPVEG